MPGFIRWQSKNSIAIYVPTGQRYPSGEPIRHYETIRRLPGETNAELEARAKARKAELELQYYRGPYVGPPKKYTVEKLLTDWLTGPVAEKFAAGELQESTLTKYTMYVKTHLIPRLGRHLVAELTEADIESAYRQMATAGLGQATIAGAHRTLHAALNWAVKKRLLPGNPAALLDKKPADPRTEHPTLDVEAVAKILAAARQTSHDLALVVSLLTGARIGEILGLRREDIDWDAGVIHIRQALKKTGMNPQFGPTKTPRSVRDIPLTPLVADILQAAIAHADEQAKKRRAKGKSYVDHGLVFCNPDGRPINRHNLGRRAFRALLARAEIQVEPGKPSIRPHDLRHSFATLAKELGIDSKIVADALGHADTTMVNRRYGHRSDRAQQILFEQLHEYLQKRT